MRLKKLLDKILDNFWEKILLQLVKFTNLFQQQQEGALTVRGIFRSFKEKNDRKSKYWIVIN